MASEPDRELFAAADSRDMGALAAAVAGRLALPDEPSGPLGRIARALADHSPVVHGADRGCCARVALEAVLKAARSCRDCGQPHVPAQVAGGSPDVTWAHPVDGHSYRERSRPAAYWLDNVLNGDTPHA